MPTFRLGINYWPRSSAMYMWERFDLGEIREDFARIAAMNLQVVRFFLMWEAFQPEPDRLDPAMLERLDGVMGAARDAGLQTMPTFFTGHMSGVNWIPAWALDPATPHGRFRTFAGGRESPYGIGNFYTGALLDAQRLHVRTIGERYRDDPALYAWDLGNEFSNMREPDSPHQAAYWSRALVDELLKASNVGVTAGTHGEDITRDRHIRPSSLCATFDFATMHGYTVYSAFSRNRLDPCTVPFLYEIAQSCANKRVLFSEFGNPQAPPGEVSPSDRVPLPGEPQPAAKDLPPHAAAYACLTEEEMPHYAYAVLDRLQRRGALGALWWCWADYAPELATQPPFDRAPHEMRFGIVDAAGEEKPVARMLSQFAREERELTDAPPPLVDEATFYANFPNVLDDTYRGYCTLFP
ncbi:MAG TPA: beta-galactosidase [Candidatus Baltobacteraceae bacterium]